MDNYTISYIVLSIIAWLIYSTAYISTIIDKDYESSLWEETILADIMEYILVSILILCIGAIALIIVTPLLLLYYLFKHINK